MKRIIIQDTITLDVDPSETADGVIPQFSFVHDFMRKCILRDPRWGKDLEWLEAAADLNGLFRYKNQGEMVDLSEDLWRKLREVVANPSNAYNPIAMIPAIRFIKAVTDAVDV